MSNNVTSEGVSLQSTIPDVSKKAKYSVTTTTATELSQKYFNTQIVELAKQKIKVPLKTAGGRVLYLDLVRAVQSDSGVVKDYNSRNGMSLPLSYLKESPYKYQPATVDDVIEDQKRICGPNFEKYEGNMKRMLETLTFISSVIL